jgi:uncharacterized protein
LFQRLQIFKDLETNSAFLWGPRQTGKSTLLKNKFSQAFIIDLLLSDVYRWYLNNPEKLRETVMALPSNTVIIIDEVQRIPQLLNEVHWLIENKQVQFILSGSSPRKILKQGGNLLGGRALRYVMLPLSFIEIPDFDLLKAINNGLIPKHYLAKNATPFLAAYIGNYLEDEIIAETKIRNASVFSGFLNKAAFSNGEIVNYTNIAADCGVKSPTVKEYFNILTETLLGYFVEAYTKNPKRRTIQAPKFYFFDVGIANYLLGRKSIELQSINFGHAFEHFIFQELWCYSKYSGKNFKISYWRTTAGAEVDFIIGANNEVAIEVKSTNAISKKHLSGLLSFNEEYNDVQKSIVVCLEPFARLLDNGILILPWKDFLTRLWNHQIIPM